MEKKMFCVGCDPDYYEWIVAESKEQVLTFVKETFGEDFINTEYEAWQTDWEGEESPMFSDFLDDFICECDLEKEFTLENENTSKPETKKFNEWLVGCKDTVPHWFATACY